MYSRGTDRDSAARLFIYRDGVPVLMVPTGYGRSDDAGAILAQQLCDSLNATTAAGDSLEALKTLLRSVLKLNGGCGLSLHSYIKTWAEQGHADAKDVEESIRTLLGDV